MAKEILSIPEEHLAVVVLVVQSGLWHPEDYPPLPEEVRTQLKGWILGIEEYLKRLEEE